MLPPAGGRRPPAGWADGARVAGKTKRRGVRHSSPLSMYSAPGVLRQGPGHGAESAIEAGIRRKQEIHGSMFAFACMGRAPCQPPAEPVRGGGRGGDSSGRIGRGGGPEQHCVEQGGSRDRCDHRRRRADRHDAGRRVALTRRARARAREGAGAERARPRVGHPRTQHRGDGPARPARPVPRARHAVSGAQLVRRHRQAVVRPPGHRPSLPAGHSTERHRTTADRARPGTRRGDPARLRAGRTEPGH